MILSPLPDGQLGTPISEYPRGMEKEFTRSPTINSRPNSAESTIIKFPMYQSINYMNSMMRPLLLRDELGTPISEIALRGSGREFIRSPTINSHPNPSE